MRTVWVSRYSRYISPYAPGWTAAIIIIIWMKNNNGNHFEQFNCFDKKRRKKCYRRKLLLVKLRYIGSPFHILLSFIFSCHTFTLMYKVSLHKSYFMRNEKCIKIFLNVCYFCCLLLQKRFHFKIKVNRWYLSIHDSFVWMKRCLANDKSILIHHAQCSNIIFQTVHTIA